MIDSVTHEANQIITQKYLRHYLPSETESNVWTVEGACISARRTARYGIPPDATCWRYVIEHPEYGWTYAVRAVWRTGKLMAPLATHTVIEGYYVDDEALIADKDAASLAINEWLQTVPL